MTLLALLLLAVVALPVVGLAAFSWYTARRVTVALPPPGRFIKVDGHRLHYTDEGSGPPVLLIHGLGGHTRNFPEELTGPLSREFRVVVVDRPGSGYSTRPFATDAGLRRQATTIGNFITHLGLERPLVVGHSFGGALALALAIDHPRLVGGLALIAPLTQPTEMVPDVFRGLVVRSRMRRLLIAWTLAVPASIRAGAATLCEVFGPDPVPADYAIKGGGLLGLRPIAFFSASSDLVAVPQDLPSLASRYRSIRMPVGILFGDHDQILAHDEHGTRAALAIPGAQLELIEGRGHMLPLVSPELTMTFIQRTAAQLAPAEGLTP